MPRCMPACVNITMACWGSVWCGADMVPSVSGGAFMRVWFVFRLRRGWLEGNLVIPSSLWLKLWDLLLTLSLSMTTEASEALSPFPGSPQAGSLSYVFSRCSRSWLFYIPVNRRCFSFCTHLSQDPWGLPLGSWEPGLSFSTGQLTSSLGPWSWHCVQEQTDLSHTWWPWESFKKTSLK